MRKRHNIDCGIALVAALLTAFAAGRAQSVPPGAGGDVAAAQGQAPQRAPEPVLEGLVRADKNTLALALGKQRLLLYGFEFNGDMVPTDKLHLKQLAAGVFEVTSIAYTVGEWRVRIRDAADYYGLGERSDTLNHARTVVHNVSRGGCPKSGGAKGSSTSKPMPFFMSTTGYGVWFDTTGDATFDMNLSSEADVIVDADAEKLRVVLFRGPEFAKILDGFTAQAGRSILPPYWAFAPWLGGGFGSDDLLRGAADKARSLNLPASVILDDAAAVPAGLKHLHEAGYKLVLPRMAGVDAKAEGYAEAAENGFLVKAADGRPYLGQAGAPVDFTNQRAKLWWQERARQAIKTGADGFTDGDGAPEGFPGEVRFADESDARVMRNRYAALFDSAMEELIERDLKGNGVVFVCGAAAGANGRGLLRGGENESSFSPESGLPTAVTAGLNAGLSGMPLWTADLGGYLNTAGGADPQLFMRWTEYAAFSPVMETRSRSNLLPWDYGEQALGVYRKFSTLHMSLFPYRYAAAEEAAKTGMPMMRALVLAYQDDEQARLARNEYLFGPDLLVAPIVDEGTQRTVYLPRGEWLDFWTGKAVAGGRVIVADAAVDTIPVYVRQGAIVPKIPEDAMTLVASSESGNEGLKTLDERRVYELFGEVAGADSETITDFEGRRLVRSAHGLKIEGDAAARITLRWRFQRVAGVTVNGAAVRVQSDGTGSFVDFDHQRESAVGWR